MNPLELAEEVLYALPFVDKKDGRKCKIVSNSIDWEKRTCSLDYNKVGESYLPMKKVSFSHLKENLVDRVVEKSYFLCPGK